MHSNSWFQPHGAPGPSAWARERSQNWRTICPSVAPPSVPAPVAALLAPAYLRERAALISPMKALPAVSAGVPLPLAAWQFAPGDPSERPSTSHFSIVDKFGDAGKALAEV